MKAQKGKIIQSKLIKFLSLFSTTQHNRVAATRIVACVHDHHLYIIMMMLSLIMMKAQLALSSLNS